MKWTGWNRVRTGIFRTSAPLALLTAGFLLASPAVAPAQTGAEAGLTVVSDPPGALVTLTGAAQLTGVSPVFFSQGIPGIYTLHVSKEGYETYTSKVAISMDKAATVRVTLKPRTRTKAAIRSLIWPGWGQFYSDRKTKGWVFTSLAVLAGGALIAAEKNYQDKRDEFDLVNDAFNRARVGGDIQQIDELRPRLFAAQADAYDAETIRWAAVGALGGVWAINFLDALFFLPSRGDEITGETPGASAVSQPTGASLSVWPALYPASGGAGVAFSLRF